MKAASEGADIGVSEKSRSNLIFLSIIITSITTITTIATNISITRKLDGLFLGLNLVDHKITDLAPVMILVFRKETRGSFLVAALVLLKTSHIDQDLSLVTSEEKRPRLLVVIMAIRGRFLCVHGTSQRGVIIPDLQHALFQPPSVIDPHIIAEDRRLRHMRVTMVVVVTTAVDRGLEVTRRRCMSVVSRASRIHAAVDSSVSSD